MGELVPFVTKKIPTLETTERIVDAIQQCVRGGFGTDGAVMPPYCMGLVIITGHDTEDGMCSATLQFDFTQE